WMELTGDQLSARLTAGNGALTYTPRAGTRLSAGTHTLEVTAAATANFKAASAEVVLTVLKAPQAIDFTGVPGGAPGGAEFTIEVSGGGSGNPVQVAASGACAIDGRLVTMTSGTGLCTLT